MALLFLLNCNLTDEGVDFKKDVGLVAEKDVGSVSEEDMGPLSETDVSVKDISGSDPTCTDEIKNGTETGIDCGGDCAPCAAIAFCGDDIVNGTEACDDGNTITERCDYGMQSCVVCDAACTEVAGATSYCGDSTVGKRTVCKCDASHGAFYPN